MQCSWISSHTSVWHQNHPPQLLSVEILDQLNTAPHIFMWKNSKGMHCFSQQCLQGGQVPPKPYETLSKNEDWQILAGNYELSPILCTDFTLEIPLSSASVHVVWLWSQTKQEERKGCVWHVCATSMSHTSWTQSKCSKLDIPARYPIQCTFPSHSHTHSSA